MAIDEDLLQAIRQAPDDDAPRLVYGDLLLSRGDPRGELIQVQCRLADVALTAAERRKLRISENKLLAEHGAAWNAEVLAAIGEQAGVARAFTPVKVELRRGFVDMVRAPAYVLRRLDALHAVAPLLTELRIDPDSFLERSTLAAADLDSPCVAGLRVLRLTLPGAGDEGARAIATCPHLSGLRALAITFVGWDPSIMIGLSGTVEAQAPGAPSPPTPSLGPEGARALATSPHLAGVRALTLDGNELGVEGVAAILDSSARWTLEELSLSNSGIDSAAVVAIADAPSSQTLRRLVLQSASMDAAAARRLASSKHLGTLAVLDLENCPLGPEGIAAFLDGLGLEALTELVLAHNGLGDAGALTVARCAKLRQLRILDITKNQIGKKSLAALASSENLGGLEKILVHDRESKEAREAFLGSRTLAGTQIYWRGKLLSKAAKAKAAAGDD